MSLSEKHCVPCRGGVPPLAAEEIERYLTQLDGWQVVDDHHITKQFRFADFKEALRFTNRVGEIAENEGHHPDIHLAWGRVAIDIWTHKIDGLTESDFILAAKIDAI